MELMHGFEITKREELPEIDGVAVEGRHVASGARLLFLQNDDNNKSFAIGFRTPPADDTGVFHILEHSVLCGSRRFPVKEPFVDLIKSSMQTFLNAMTFADKTLYPVASTNEQDLFNLMDVYLDAVFHPNIYEKRAIFEQEGWHYELHANDAEARDAAALGADETTLVHNGVVFNEMKGALSDANSVLYDEVQAALFPGTCYAFESGGTPAAIPTLTYEGYLDEHRRHYRTDNSYIILYGNLDVDRALAFLDERYLTPVAAEQAERDAAREAAGLEPLVPREIEACEVVGGTLCVTLPQMGERCGGSDKPVTVKVPAALGAAAGVAAEAPFARKEMVTAPENACAACGYVIGGAGDRVRALAADILLDALLGSNEAPLKRALLDAGLAHDVHAFVSDALLQPFAMVQLQMPAPGAGERLHGVVGEEVRKLVESGFDRALVEAALSHSEFEMREHDMGMADGVANAMISLTGWLYDDDAATVYLRYEEAFAELRAKLEQGYFERLAIELFCENEHVAAVEVVPVEAAGEDEAAARLAEMNRALSAEERERIVAGEAKLRELQEAPDAPEAVALLPRLSIDDIDGAPVEPAYALDPEAPVACVRHDVPTHGIAYAYRYFDLNAVTFDDLPYVSVLANALGKLDTARHTAAEIDTLVQGKLGNLSFFSDVFELEGDIARVAPKFVVSASSLSGNAEWLATLPREVMLETDFSNTGKILDVLKQRKIGMEHAFANSGHSCATGRVKSYYAPAGVLREQLGNVGFYRFLCDLIEHFDERAEALSARLADVAARLFRDDQCVVSFAGPDEAYGRFWAAGPTVGDGGDRSGTGPGPGSDPSPTGRPRPQRSVLVAPEPVVRNEAFVVPSDVSYTATGWDRRLLVGEAARHSGAWLVAARALSYDFLWNEVRVKGGAYGTGFQAARSGNLRFYSYRDPHLDETLARFAASADWLAGFDPAREALEGFVVATVASLDAPVKPRMLIRRQMGDYFTGHGPEDRVERRRQVIATDVEALRALAPVVRDSVAQGAVCAFGNRDILEGASADFDVITLVG